MDTVYLKVKTYESLSKALIILRKYRKNTAMGDIKQAIENNGKILECDYLSTSGLKRIAKCYDELAKAGIICDIFDEEDMLISREILGNQIHSYQQTDADIQAQIDMETSDD